MTKSSNPIKRHTISNDRAKTVFFFFMGCFGLIFFRALWLQNIPLSQKKLSHLGNRSYLKKSNDVSYRGTIFDHKKRPLAISIKAPSLAINPQIFRPSKKQLRKLAKILEIPQSRIKALQKKKNYFAWLKRKVSAEQAAAVKKLDIKGLTQTIEPARFYPGKSSGAQLIGLVGTDNFGLFGLEKSLDEELAGRKKNITKLKDARGLTILTNSLAAAPQEAGNNVVLTIDKVIQGITEEALEKAFLESAAKSAFAIVADPYTGQILAMANRPTFDPNDTENLVIRNTKNNSIRALIEPASVIKPLVISHALEVGVVGADQPHNCEFGAYKIDQQSTIHDEYSFEYLTTSETIIHSSNICTYKIAKTMGREMTYKALKRFGLATHIPSPLLKNAKVGYIAPWEDWREIRFANISFGQGFSTTGLEIIKAYSAIANGGFLVEPQILQRIETANESVLTGQKNFSEKKVLSRETSKLMREILYRAVEEGTGKNAKLKHYSAAGKTGTAEKYSNEEKRYSREKRIASFAGFAPALDPHLVAYIVIDEPQKKPYYGGVWAAPVFKEIMEQSLKYLNIPSEEKPKLPELKLTKEPDENQAVKSSF